MYSLLHHLGSIPSRVSYFVSPLRHNSSHTPSQRTSEKATFLVKTAVLNLYHRCDTNSLLLTQALYGHTVKLLKHKPNGWGLIKTHDGHVGHTQLENLVTQEPCPPTRTKIALVASLHGIVYPEPNPFKKPIVRLPFNSRVMLAESSGNTDTMYKKLHLVNGTTGWIHNGDIEEPQKKNIQEILELSQTFLGIPYLIGGTSSRGFDCSGLVQTLFIQMGFTLPRKCLAQSRCEQLIPVNTAEPGDLLFFGDRVITHVGLYLENGYFIHCGLHAKAPRVSIEQLDTTKYQLLMIKRPYRTSD